MTAQRTVYQKLEGAASINVPAASAKLTACADAAVISTAASLGSVTAPLLATCTDVGCTLDEEIILRRNTLFARCRVGRRDREIEYAAGLASLERQTVELLRRSNPGAGA